MNIDMNKSNFVFFLDKNGLELTYKWIEKEISKKLNNNKFTVKY